MAVGCSVCVGAVLVGLGVTDVMEGLLSREFMPGTVVNAVLGSGLDTEMVLIVIFVIMAIQAAPLYPGSTSRGDCVRASWLSSRAMMIWGCIAKLTGMLTTYPSLATNPNETTSDEALVRLSR